MSSPATGNPYIPQAITYNGFTFPSGTLTRNFTVSPVQDETKRTIIYSVFAITLEFYISGTPADAQFANMLSRLTQPAAAFRYRGRGMTDIQVNLLGARDVIWGPFPTVAECSPRGSDRTVKVVWTINFAIPTCGDARYTGPMEFQYSTDIAIDKAGITTRTYKGFIRVAQTRRDIKNRRVLDSADLWREKINPPLIDGFRRIPGQFSLSADKCRLDFSIVDEEFPGPNFPPPNVIEVDSEHSYTNQQPGDLAKWVGHLSATYKLPKNRDLTVNSLGIHSAVTAFGKLAVDRLDDFIKGKAGFGVFGGKASGIKPSIIPITFTASDLTIHGQTQVHLEMSYRVAGASLAQIMNFGGLWRAVPGSDWELWATSIKDPLSSRGLAQIRFTPGEEEIVDLCARIPPEPPKKQTRRRPRRRGRFVPANLPSVFPPPAVSRSWIDYNASVRAETDAGNVVGVTLPTSPLERSDRTDSVWDALGRVLPGGADRSLSPVATDVKPTDGGDAAMGKVFVQQRTKPIVYLYLSGYAMRAGYPIPQPSLVEVNGKAVTPVGGSFQQAIVGQGGLDGSIPIYAARWNLPYVVTEMPTGKRGLPVPPNPVQA